MGTKKKKRKSRKKSNKSSLSNVHKTILSQQQEISSLKRLEKYRRTFIGNVSHELKTPIFSIQGYIHTLLDGGLEDQKINRKFLKKAANNVDRLQTIVEDLEIMARLEAETVALDIQEINLVKLCQSIIADNEALAKTKEITLKLDQKSKNEYLALGDEEYIRAVINNLIVNSIKYGIDKGQTIIKLIEKDAKVKIEVMDNGVGIASKHLPHIFDRFYRIDKSRSRSMGGSGLGLSIVKHILEAHNQTMTVNSEAGVGSTFSFVLEKPKV